MTGLSFTAIQVIFLLAASTLTAGADTLVVRWLSGLPWRRSAFIGLLGLVPFAVTIAGFFLFLHTPYYESQIAWTMTFGLPLLIFLGLLLLAWMAKTILLCFLAGAKAGLLAGLLVFPLLWSGILSGKGILWKSLDALRVPNTLEEAVGRNNTRYLRRNLNEKTRSEIFFFALEQGNADAVKLALDAGADPNAPLGYGPSSPRTPLLWAIASAAPPEKRLAVVKLLLARGADPNAPSPLPVYYSSSPALGKAERPTEAAKAEGDATLERILREAGAE
jgi:hypothetical protein